MNSRFLTWIREPNNAARAGAFLVLAFVLVRNLWLGDDAFITLRVVDNFLNGYGLTWNVAERVQVYTNPLWTFALIPFYWAIEDPFSTLYVTSLIFSLISVVLMLRFSERLHSTILITFALAFSLAFVDYSSSGLENPLSHVLILLFYWIYFKHGTRGTTRLFQLSLMASLLAVNRLDTLILVSPALAYEIYIQREPLARRLRAVVTGFLPLILWEAFSLVYYGFLLPNTFYAKAALGIERIDIAHVGALYILNSLSTDPVTWIVIFSALLFSLIQRQERNTIVMAGAMLYVGYIVWVGGDYMAGRFFALPFIAALVTLLTQAQHPEFFRIRNLLFTSAASIVLLFAGLAIDYPPPLARADWGIDSFDMATGISNEKLFNFQETGRLNFIRNESIHPWAQIGLDVRDSGTPVFETIVIGLIGYYSGPEVYILDRLVLADPLRARLPLATPQRVGHYGRPIPHGYLETVKSGFAENLIEHPDLRTYYEKLQIITQSENLLSIERLATIARFNVGYYEPLKASYLSSEEWMAFTQER